MFMYKWMMFGTDEACSCSCGADAEHEHEDACCGGSCDCGCEDGEDEADAVIELVDPESGETFQFYLADEFTYQEQDYCVLVTLDEEPEYVIARMVEDEDGEGYIETLTEDESDDVYEEYERLLEDYAEDDETDL